MFGSFYFFFPYPSIKKDWLVVRDRWEIEWRRWKKRRVFLLFCLFFLCVCVCFLVFLIGSGRSGKIASVPCNPLPVSAWATKRCWLDDRHFKKMENRSLNNRTLAFFWSFFLCNSWEKKVKEFGNGIPPACSFYFSPFRMLCVCVFRRDFNYRLMRALTRTRK